MEIHEIVAIIEEIRGVVAIIARVQVVVVRVETRSVEVREPSSLDLHRICWWKVRRHCQ